VRLCWCSHCGMYNLVWEFDAAGFLWRATIWCNGTKIFLLFGIFGGHYKDRFYNRVFLMLQITISIKNQC